MSNDGTSFHLLIDCDNLHKRRYFTGIEAINEFFIDNAQQAASGWVDGSQQHAGPCEKEHHCFRPLLKFYDKPRILGFREPLFILVIWPGRRAGMASCRWCARHVVDKVAQISWYNLELFFIVRHLWHFVENDLIAYSLLGWLPRVALYSTYAYSVWRLYPC